MKTTIITILILLASAVILSACTAQNTSMQYDAVAKCMTANGVVMYGTGWCTHCQAQKHMFGNSFQYIHFVDCDANTQTCKDVGVQGYPTWAINGSLYPGEQSMYLLAGTSGCMDALLNSTG